MSAEIEYRGYTIRFNENADEWNCYEAKATNVSLAKVKAKIDRLHRDMRKAASFDCVYLGSMSGSSVQVLDARAIDYRTSRRRRSIAPNESEVYNHHEVATMRQGWSGGRAAKGKNWDTLDRYAPAGPETQAALDIVMERAAEVRFAEDRLRAAWAAVPRLSLDDLGDLVHAATTATLEE